MAISPQDSFALEHYGYNLTALAREGRFPPLVGYDSWVSRIFDILLRKGQNGRSYNPILLEGVEIRRWQVALEVVRRMAIGQAPDPLSSFQVIAPSYVALCAASSHAAPQEMIKTAGEGVEELTHLLSWPSADSWGASEVVFPHFEAFFRATCQAGTPILLLLHDVHRLLGGEPQPYAINLLNELIPALSRRQIQFLGMSTIAPFRQYIERIAAIQRCVQPVMMRPDEEV